MTRNTRHHDSPPELPTARKESMVDNNANARLESPLCSLSAAAQKVMTQRQA
jgi:hypothetical protein